MTYDNPMTTDAQLKRLLTDVRTIAVLGIKPESHAGQPAHDIPEYLMEHGYEVIPVPVYYPDVTSILGKPVYRSLEAAAKGTGKKIDLVNVFRRSQDVEPHVEDIIAVKPRAVWMQSGISSAAAAKRLEAEGIEVIQDRCIFVDHRRLM